MARLTRSAATSAAIVRQGRCDLRTMGELSEAAFLQNRERQYAVLHALQLAIEASVEIATHICAADALGIPSSYAEAFDLLERAAIVDATLAEDLRRMARFRNRIVHLSYLRMRDVNRRI